MHHAVLATRRLNENHTSDIILKELNMIEQEFNILNKISGETTDNASNMQSVGNKRIFFKNIKGHVNCFAHTLQLAVEDGSGMREISLVTGQCRKCVAHFNRSHLVSDAIEKFQINQGEK